MRFLQKKISRSPNYHVSFFPYQLDLYSSSDKCIVDEPLTESTLQSLERKWPALPFEMRADGKSKYPLRGGHDNTAARMSALEIIPHGQANDPVALIQITDTTLNEAPGSPTDDLVRNKTGRTEGLDSSSLVALSIPGSPFIVGDGQRLNLWLYGPSQLTALHTPWVLYVVIALSLVLAAYVVLRILGTKLSFLTFHTAKSFAVVVPGNGSFVLASGERLAIVGKGSPDVGNIAILDGPNLPPAKLFEIEVVQGTLRARNGYVTVEDGIGNSQPSLKIGLNELILKRDNLIRRISVEIRDI